MIQLCRHVLHEGAACKAAALHGKLRCRHHDKRHALLARVRRATGGATRVLPIVFSEDRASIQHNLHLVLHALIEGTIDNQTASILTRTLRASALNLGKKPLIEAENEDIVQRIILTPEGDEIAPPREVLEEGEIAPIHSKICPCQRCAEQYRGARPEQHHHECQCGLCEDSPSRQTLRPPAPVGRESTVEAPLETEVSSRPERSEVEESALSLSKGPTFLYPATTESEPGEKSGTCTASKGAPAAKFYEYRKKQTPKSQTLYQLIYGDDIKRHEAEYAAKAAAAVEAGLEPPAYEPFDPATAETEAERRERAEEEQLEKNRQIGREIWIRRYGTPPPPRGLSWEEREDLNRAAHLQAANSQ